MSKAQSVSVPESKDEYLAQLGIKRGSSLTPLVALGIVLFGIYIAFSPIGDRASAIFAETCANASAASLTTSSAITDAPSEGVASLSGFQSTNLADFVARCGQGNFHTGTYEQRIYNFAELTQDHAAGFLGDNVLAFVPAFVDLLKGYFRNEFLGQASESSSRLVGSQIWILVWTVGLALIPGVLGMIYRRAFWWWFGAAFVPAFLVAQIRWFGQIESTPLVYLFYLILFQLAVLTLAFRLRRYTADKSGSTRLYNSALAVILIGVALAWYFGSRSLPELFASGMFYQCAAVLIGLPLIYSLARRSDLWAGTAPKNIVVCLDGTTNTPDQFEFGRLAQTNVFKLFKMLKSEVSGSAPGFNATFNKSYGDKQIGLYYSGVGNRFDYNPLVQVLGGATGLGAADVVSRSYLDIMRVYRPGDRIFLFGFSRGAAIARLLARAIDQQGAPQTIWALYLFGRHVTVWSSKRRGNVDLNVPVTVLGCWDTVAAFGIGKNIAGIEFQKLDLFKDLTVSDNVEQAYHMVALDELREEFQPTLMEPDPIRPGRIVEVWFSGDHANIGGGWSTTKLSDLTLNFQLMHVSSGYACKPGMRPGDETWGIYLSAVNANSRPEAVVDAPSDTEKESDDLEVRPDALGQLRRWDSTIYNYIERSLPDHAVISESVFDRMCKAKPLYAPKSLLNHHRQLKARYESIVSDVSGLAETNSILPVERDAILENSKTMTVLRFAMELSPEQTISIQNKLQNSRAGQELA